MTLIVQKAAEELQPALEQIKLETGQDHSALFEHPPFLAQIADALLTGHTPRPPSTADAIHGALLRRALARPVSVRWIKFFERLNRAPGADDTVGIGAARISDRGTDSRPERQYPAAGRDRRADRRDAGRLPEQIAEAHRAAREDAPGGLGEALLGRPYAECNELPLASDAPPDVTQPKARPACSGSTWTWTSTSG